MDNWTWFYLKIRDFSEFFVKVIFLCLTINFIIKSVLNIRETAKLGVEQKRGHFENLM